MHTNGGAVGLPGEPGRASCGSAGRKRPRSTPAVDHLDATARLGHRGLEPGTQPLRHGDGTRRATNRQARGRPHGARPESVLQHPARAQSRRSVPCPPARRAGRPARGSAHVTSGWNRRAVAATSRASLACRDHPPRRSTTARAIVCPRASSACSRSATNVPSAGAPGPGYICETSRIRIERSLPGRHLDEPEAHLVARPRPRGRGAPRRSAVSCRHVTRSTSPGSAADRAFERVGRLPVEAPARDLEQEPRAGVPGESSTRIERPRRCMWPATAWIVTGRPTSSRTSTRGSGPDERRPCRRAGAGRTRPAQSRCRSGRPGRRPPPCDRRAVRSRSPGTSSTGAGSRRVWTGVRSCVAGMVVSTARERSGRTPFRRL